jgi:ParB family chromosome partitioning protein
MSRLGLTQNEVADRIHRSRSAVANTLRLLELPAEMQEALARGRVTMGHAKALLSLREPGLRERFFKRVTDEELSVRDTEELVSLEATKPAPASKKQEKPGKPAHLRELEGKLEARLQTRVRIHERKGRGKISIHFLTPETFERLFGMLTR